MISCFSFAGTFSSRKNSFVMRVNTRPKDESHILLKTEEVVLHWSTKKDRYTVQTKCNSVVFANELDAIHFSREKLMSFSSYFSRGSGKYSVQEFETIFADVAVPSQRKLNDWKPCRWTDQPTNKNLIISQNADVIMPSTYRNAFKPKNAPQRSSWD